MKLETKRNVMFALIMIFTMGTGAVVLFELRVSPVFILVSSLIAAYSFGWYDRDNDNRKE